MKSIVIIVGSIRKNSFNLQLANRLLSFNEGTFKICDIASLPFMSQDIEFPHPNEVSLLREEIRKADGIWIMTPEYNFHVPGVLKNALDWLSRSETFLGPRETSPVYGKKVAFSSVAGRSEGLGARKNLYSIVAAMGMKPLNETGVGFSLTKEEFETDLLNWTPERAEKLEKEFLSFLDFLSQEG